MGESSAQAPGWQVEHRDRAVMEVPDGSSASGCLVRGLAAVGLHVWRDRYAAAGIDRDRKSVV